MLQPEENDGTYFNFNGVKRVVKRVLKRDQSAISLLILGVISCLVSEIATMQQHIPNYTKIVIIGGV